MLDKKPLHTHTLSTTLVPLITTSFRYKELQQFSGGYKVTVSYPVFYLNYDNILLTKKQYIFHILSVLPFLTMYKNTIFIKTY